MSDIHFGTIDLEKGISQEGYVENNEMKYREGTPIPEAELTRMREEHKPKRLPPPLPKINPELVTIEKSGWAITSPSFGTWFKLLCKHAKVEILSFESSEHSWGINQYFYTIKGPKYVVDSVFRSIKIYNAN